MARTAARRLALRVAVAALALQLTNGLIFAWGAVAPYARADGWPPLLVGAVFSATPASYAVGMVAAGRLADHLPPRRICAVSLGLLAAGFGVAFIFPSAFTFVAFFSGLGLGLGGGFALAGGMAAARQVFPQRVGTIGGALTAAYAFAGLVQIPVAGTLAAGVGWINAIRIVGVASELVAVAAVLLLPSLPAPRAPASRAAGGGGASAAEERHAGLASLSSVAARPAVWTGQLILITAAPLGTFVFVELGTYATGKHVGLWLATLALTAAAAANGGGRLAAGAASDRFGVNRVLLLILAADLAAAALLWAAPDSSGSILLLAAVGAGQALGGAAGVVSRLASDAAPDAPNTAFGLMFAAYAVGAFIGPLLGPAVGAGAVAWLVVGGLAVPGLALLAMRVRLGHAGVQPA